MRGRKHSPHLKVADPSQAQQGLGSDILTEVKPARVNEMHSETLPRGEKKGKSQNQNLGIQVHDGSQKQENCHKFEASRPARSTKQVLGQLGLQW